MPSARRTFRSVAALAALLVGALAAVGLDAHRRRGEARATDAALLAVAPRLPAADLALSGGARWLRAPTTEEPGAAAADGIAFPDPDPGGGALVPPAEAYGTATGAPRRHP